MTKTSNERVHDNVCAATCRMIMASKTSLPLNQVSETVPMLSLRSMYFPNLVIKSRALINLIHVKQNCGYCITCNSKPLCVFVYILALYVLDFGFQVLPSVLQCLPLKEDFEENKTVFDCLCQLYLSGEQEVK